MFWRLSFCVFCSVSVVMWFILASQTPNSLWATVTGPVFLCVCVWGTSICLLSDELNLSHWWQTWLPFLLRWQKEIVKHLTFSSLCCIIYTCFASMCLKVIHTYVYHHRFFSRTRKDKKATKLRQWRICLIVLENVLLKRLEMFWNKSSLNIGTSLYQKLAQALLVMEGSAGHKNTQHLDLVFRWKW